jgi:glycosyltransferase involved in cell wall biosynthesis
LSYSSKETRIAWLQPSFFQGDYWHPIFKQFTQRFPRTAFYTTYWPGYAAGFEGSFHVEKIGKAHYVAKPENGTDGYDPGTTSLPLSLAIHLLRQRPQVVVTSAFSIWTLLAIFLKPIGRWKVMVFYDGSSPTVDFRNSPLRIFLRRFITRFTDAFASNTHAGTEYLTQVLHARPDRIAEGVYLVPDFTALSGLAAKARTAAAGPGSANPVMTRFLFAGQIVQRKGIKPLLKAASILKEKGKSNFTLTFLGDGPQREEMRGYGSSLGLGGQVHWAGKVSYGDMARHYAECCAIVLPCFEDVWGMVVPEAMLFEKAVLCSRLAGVHELVEHGVNGFVFDPYKPEELAGYMENFMENPALAAGMGRHALDTMRRHSTESATRVFIDAVALARNEAIR